jgi:glutathione S-transferase
MQLKLIIGNKNYSSWSLRSWLLLKEAGIEFEEYRIALDVPDSAAEIARFSPVAERWPEKELWPADAAARAHARSVSAEMHAGFSTLREAMPMNCRAMGRRVSLPDALTADIDRVLDIWSESGQTVIAGIGHGETGCLAVSAWLMRCSRR